MNSTKPALYFDLTDIAEHAMTHTVVTGVQRSVLKILESVITRNNGRQVFGLVKHPLTGQFLMADLSFLREPYDLSDFASRFELSSGKSRWLARKLLRYGNRPFRRFLHANRLRLQWAASKKLRDEVLKAPRRTLPSVLLEAAVEPGSYIVSLGSGSRSDYAGLSNFARLNGCEVVSFVYDTIPVCGHSFAKDKNRLWASWIAHITKESALILAASSFTKKELEAHFRRNGLSAEIAVVRFPHEFKYSSARRKDPIREDVAKIAQGSYALCVGTFEMRKNTLGLLQAWRELKGKRPSDPTMLVLAGGKGRGGDEVFAFLRETENIGGKATIVEKPNDAELELLYRHCQFTVFPSFYEGWGLPIGESLWFGKPVLCANSSSMPEVGGNFATYFDHDKPGSLVNKLQEMIDDPAELPENIRDYLTSWDDTAASLLYAIDGRTQER